MAGLASAADFAKVTSEKMSKFRGQGQTMFWNPFEKDQTIKRRRDYVRKLLQGALKGLAYMHDNDRLHQSLGPSSIVINYKIELECAFKKPLRNFSYYQIRHHLAEGSNGLPNLQAEKV